MRLLVTGRDGQVGWELQRCLQGLGEVVALGRTECDLAAPDALDALLDRVRPDVIVNAAAYTAVDRAEQEEALATRINGESPGRLAQWAARAGAALVHFSTDYVFDGSGTRPWQVGDPVAPLSAYGRSKAAGERAIAAAGGAHLILRTSWVYAGRGGNFLRTMLRLSRERELLRVVADQHGAPTWARTIAQVTALVLARAGRGREEVCRALNARGGTHHLVARGETTWHGFARRIFELAPDPERRLQRLEPIATAEYPLPARRPANSRLDTSGLAEQWGVLLPAWDDALALCLAELPGGR